MSKELFEVASRRKFRFDSVKGLLTVEDLWELPLTSTVGKANLDDIAKALNRLLKSTEEVSFVNASQGADAAVSVVQDKFDIVKYIIGVRIEERNLLNAASDRAAKKQQILGILANRANEELNAVPTEDLQKLAASL